MCYARPPSRSSLFNIYKQANGKRQTANGARINHTPQQHQKSVRHPSIPRKSIPGIDPPTFSLESPANRYKPLTQRVHSYPSFRPEKKPKTGNQPRRMDLSFHSPLHLYATGVFLAPNYPQSSLFKPRQPTRSTSRRL